jgi:CubicO group peptidase (beta-lactamase class C family)
MADIAAGKPYSVDSRQRIASITKTMIGLSVMALVDEGRLSLDDNVPALLPDIAFHGPADSLTVWNLLTHTGGIGEAPSPNDLSAAFSKLFAESDPSKSLPELYDDGVTLEVEPGAKWAYANHGFTLLGEILERTEKAPLHDILQQRVFGPLAMTSSDIRDLPHPDLAQGYTQAATEDDWRLIDFFGIELESKEAEDGHNMPGKFARVWGNPAAGGAQSTVTDMATYACTLLRDSGGIVRPETFARMTADQYRPDKRLPGWGLSFGVQERGPYRAFGHGGAAFGGWNSYMNVFPDLDAAIIFHMNLWSNSFESMTPYVINAFLGLDDAAPDGLATDPGILESAPGIYELPGNTPLTDLRPRFNHGRIMIRNEGDGLVLYARRGAWKDGARLTPASPGDPEAFNIRADGLPAFRMTLVRGSDGKVGALRLASMAQLVRNTELEPWVK